MLKIKEYKELILKEQFFEAHEALEEFWFPKRKEKSSYVLIIKGFINAAVAFELKKRGRLNSAKRVWQTYTKFMQLLLKEPNSELLELKEFVDNFSKEYLFKTSKML
jgi:cell shape-determining protein MreC